MCVQQSNMRVLVPIVQRQSARHQMVAEGVALQLAAEE